MSEAPQVPDGESGREVGADAAPSFEHIDFTRAPDAGPEPHMVHDRWAHRRAEPRAFAVFWLMYLIAVFVLSTGAGGGLGLVAYDVYRSVARTMLVLMSVGVCALWPLVRLSQATPERIWRAAWQDFVVVVVPLLLICLPQSASWMADWPLEVSIRLWMCLTLWAVAVSMLIACAQRRGWSPAVSTMVCLLVCFGGALFAVFPPAANGGAIGVEVVGFRELVSAPTALLEMTQDRSWSGLNARITDRHWLALVPPGLAALVFGLTGVFAPGERRA